MKRTIILSLTDEELLELQRILLDADKDAAYRFLKKHFADKVKGKLEGAGHCKPYFEVFGQNAVPGQFDKPDGKQ
jgi:hypothetical protein